MGSFLEFNLILEIKALILISNGPVITPKYSSLYFPQLLNCCSCTVEQEICATVQLLSRLVSELQLKLHYLKNQPESRTTTATQLL